MVDQVHSSLTGADDHEPKGTEGASAGQIYVADGVGGGSGSGTWTDIKHTQQGVYDYHDTNTTGSPIALTLANTQYKLTNDGLGANTNLGGAYSDIANLWDTGTDTFNFTGMSQYDTVEIRFDVTYTTGLANTAISLFAEFGSGGGLFQIPLIEEEEKKTAKAHRITPYRGAYFGSADVINSPATIYAQADKTGTTVTVNGWYIRPARTI